MSMRVSVGDIFEIPTSGGRAYAQCTHFHREFGYVIRVLPGFYEERPKEFGEIVNQRERFVTIFPLQAVIDRKIFEIVAHSEVPESAKGFPLFRAGVEDPVTKKVKNWWLWDGEKEWMVGPITDAERELPVREVWSAPLLVERIETEWRPSLDPA